MYLAIRMSEHDGLGSWLASWAADDFTYRVVMGVAVGIGVGWLLSHYVFWRIVANSAANAESS
ncbi:MAG: hypothetical protein AAFN40_23835 [Cyanobacteria bacterium J06560_6]